MANVLGSLLVELSVNTAAFVDGLDKATYKSKQAAKEIGAAFSGFGRDIAGILGGIAGPIGSVFGEVLEGTGSALSKIAGEMGSLGGASGAAAIGLSALAAASVAAVSGIVALAVETAKANDAIFHQAQIAGVSYETLQRLGAGAKMYEISTEELSMSLARMDRMAIVAAQSTNYSATAFGHMGVNVRDANGHLKNSETLFNEVFDKLSQMSNGSERTALAMEVFSRSGMRLIPALSEGSAKMKEYADFAQRVGAVLTDEAGESAHEFSVSLEKLGLISSGMKNKLTEGLIEPLTQIINAYADASHGGDAFVEVGDRIGRMLKGLASEVAEDIAFFKQLADALAKVNLTANLPFSIATEGPKKALAEFKTDWNALSEEQKKAEDDAQAFTSSLNKTKKEATATKTGEGPDISARRTAGGEAFDKDLVQAFIEKQREAVQEQIRFSDAVGQSEASMVVIKAQAEAEKAIAEKRVEIEDRLKSLRDRQKDLTDNKQFEQAAKLDVSIGRGIAQLDELKKKSSEIESSFVFTNVLKSMNSVDEAVRKTTRSLTDELSSQRSLNEAYISGEQTDVETKVDEKLKSEKESVETLTAEYERLRSIKPTDTTALDAAKKLADDAAQGYAQNRLLQSEVVIQQEVTRVTKEFGDQNETIQRQIGYALDLADAYKVGGKALVGAQIASELDSEKQKIHDLTEEIEKLSNEAGHSQSEIDDLAAQLRAANDELNKRLDLLQREKALKAENKVGEETLQLQAEEAAQAIIRGAELGTREDQRKAASEAAITKFKMLNPEVATMAGTGVNTPAVTHPVTPLAPVQKPLGDEDIPRRAMSDFAVHLATATEAVVHFSSSLLGFFQKQPGIPANLPQYADGGMVPETGPALLHAGERVLNTEETGIYKTLASKAFDTTESAPSPTTAIPTSAQSNPGIVSTIVNDLKSMFGSLVGAGGVKYEDPKKFGEAFKSLTPTQQSSQRARTRETAALLPHTDLNTQARENYTHRLESGQSTPRAIAETAYEGGFGANMAGFDAAVQGKRFAEATGHLVAPLTQQLLGSARDFAGSEGLRSSLRGVGTAVIPGFEEGGTVGQTGTAVVHSGEVIVPASQASQLTGSSGEDKSEFNALITTLTDSLKNLTRALLSSVQPFVKSSVAPGTPVAAAATPVPAAFAASVSTSPLSFDTESAPVTGELKAPDTAAVDNAKVAATREQTSALDTLASVGANAAQKKQDEINKTVDDIIKQHDLSAAYRQQTEDLTLATAEVEKRINTYNANIEAGATPSEAITKGGIEPGEGAATELSLIAARREAYERFEHELDQTTLKYGTLTQGLKAFLNELALEGTAANTQQKFFQTMKSAIDGAESSLAKFVVTGRGSFLQVLASMEEGLVKLVIQLVVSKLEMIALNAIMGLFGGGNSGTAAVTKAATQSAAMVEFDAMRASADVFVQAIEGIPFPANLAAAPALAAATHAEVVTIAALELGGQVTRGQTYLVGEKGPELFTSSESGMMLPSDKTAAALNQVKGMGTGSFNTPGGSYLSSENRETSYASSTVTRGESSTANTVNHVKPEINIYHSGGNMSDTDIEAAVRKGIRRGTLSLT